MNVSKIRKRAEMTQSDFAATLGVSKRTVQYWEEGKLPSGAGMLKLMQFMTADEKINLGYQIADVDRNHEEETV